MTGKPSLHHVMTAIPLDGEAAARAFYVDVLGLEEVQKPAILVQRGGLWVSTSTLDVHLGVDPGFVSARKAHIALVVDDLDTVRARLSASNFEPGPIEFELPGFRRCYVDDPFGNRIELMQSL